MTQSKKTDREFIDLKEGQFITIRPTCLGIGITKSSIRLEFGDGDTSQKGDPIKPNASILINLHPKTCKALSSALSNAYDEYTKKFEKTEQKMAINKEDTDE